MTLPLNLRLRAMQPRAAVALLALAACGRGEPLAVIHTAGGARAEVALEIAATPEAQARGLMYRRTLADGRGMLFVFPAEAPHEFWMKNTFIPLDMIFIARDGRIVRIAENTEVQSERIISSGAPVIAVLEVIAGTARKYGIAPGDRVAHPIFKRR